MWLTGLWIGRPLTEQEGEFILATLDKWNCKVYYWIPDPTNETHWQDGCRFWVKFSSRKTWETIQQQLSDVLKLEMVTRQETSRTFESELGKSQPMLTQETMREFLAFTQRYLRLLS